MEREEEHSAHQRRALDCLDDAIAQAFAYSKISPRKVITLSKREKNFLDAQFEIEQNGEHEDDECETSSSYEGHKITKKWYVDCDKGRCGDEECPLKQTWYCDERSELRRRI